MIAETVNRTKDLEDTEKVETQVQKLLQRPRLPSQKTYLERKGRVTLFFALMHSTGLGLFILSAIGAREKEMLHITGKLSNTQASLLGNFHVLLYFCSLVITVWAFFAPTQPP